jgi:hypothetical protein
MQENLVARDANMQVWLQGIISKGATMRGAVTNGSITKVNPDEYLDGTRPTDSTLAPYCCGITVLSQVVIAVKL